MWNVLKIFLTWTVQQLIKHKGKALKVFYARQFLLLQWLFFAVFLHFFLCPTFILGLFIAHFTPSVPKRFFFACFYFLDPLLKFYLSPFHGFVEFVLFFFLSSLTSRWEDDPSVHQVHGLWHFPPQADVSGDIQLLVSMLQQQPLQLRQRSYHGNTCPGPDGLPAECLLVLAVNNRCHSAILKNRLSLNNICFSGLNTCFYIYFQIPILWV